MEFIDYLKDNYGYDEPIFSNELTKELKQFNPNTIRQHLKKLVDTEKIYRFKNGIYFIPNPNSPLKKKSLSVNKVINKKYIYDGEKVIGYITGLSFANSLQLTTQNPGVVEIVTNNETNRVRKVVFNKRTVELRKPRVKVTNSNYKLLQVLDLLNNFEKLSFKSVDEVNAKISDYLKDITISRQLIDEYLKSYPMKTNVRFRERELLRELTHQQ